MKLGLKITILIFVIITVIGFTGGAVILDVQKKTSIEQFHKTSETVALLVYDSLAHHMISHASLGQIEIFNHIQESVTRIADRDPLTGLLLISPQGKIIVSGNISDIGNTCNEQNFTQAILTQTRVDTMQVVDGNRSSQSVLPIMNRVECSYCHGGDENLVLGAIVVDLDGSALDAHLTKQLQLYLFIGITTFISVGAALSVTIKREILNPLSRIVDVSKKIVSGDFSTRTGLSGKDEINYVAQTFDNMADQIEKQLSNLETLNADLEEKVQERTQEVKQLAETRGQLLSKLMSAQEEERQRLARELHDESSQAIMMLVTNLARIKDLLPENEKEAKKLISASKLLAEQTSNELRRLIQELRPGVLDQLGLLPAVRSLAHSRLDPVGIHIEFNFSNIDRNISKELEVTLYRIIQEAITNIVRHADASEVRISINSDGSVINAVIEDNGKGLDVARVLGNDESWGLQGIQERINLLDGKMNLESIDGKGTKLHVQIPLGKE